MADTVFLTRRIPEGPLARLRDAVDLDLWPGELPPPREELLRRVADCDGLLCMLTDKIDGELLDAGPRLRVVSQMAVGYENIDVAAATARGIPVGNTPGVLAETTADLAWMLLLAAARRALDGVRYIETGQWRTWDPIALLSADVHGATLGIVGLGGIGAAVARRARGFDMRVLYTGPREKPELAAQVGATFADFAALLRESDFVSIHSPLTPQTRQLFNAETFALMKPGAVLVNTARGGIVDQDALLDAVRSGLLGGAGLDVTDPEPIPPEHPLLHQERVIVVPHMGSGSVRTRTRMAELAVENLLAGLRGERLRHCVNPEAQAPDRG
jgi:lactate dehydrogenase-like 2-hydroxyacid dehydrogenase